MGRRILLFITDLEIGGTPTVVRELAILLNAPPEVEIEVACLSKWGPVADQLRDAGIRVTAFNCGGSFELFSAVKQLESLVRGGTIERRDAEADEKDAEKQNAEKKVAPFDTVFSFLIHANTVAAIASRKLTGVRFLQSIQTIQPKPRWHWWVQAMIHSCAEHIVVPSSVVAEVAGDRCGIERERIEVIPNAIDPGAFPRVDVFHLPRVRVGYLGRLDPAKSPATLVDAVVEAQDDDIELHYFGEGSARFEINGAIVRNGLQSRAFVHGPVAKPQAAMAQMDVLCLPSWVEGFGLVLIEAMASGVPVIACDAGGVRDVVTHEVNGLLVRDRKHAVREFARYIKLLREDFTLRARLIEAGLTTVRERFTWHAVAAQYRALLVRPPSSA